MTLPPLPVPLNEMIDHTNLKASATEDDIAKLCHEAIQHQFASVCVNPARVAFCGKIFSSSFLYRPKICSVVDFPFGASTIGSKAHEASCAVEAGAKEIDLVIDIGALLDRNDTMVSLGIKEVRRIIAPNVTLKVIIECCYLGNDDQKRNACWIACDAGADFVKTSTGFGTSGATFEDVRLMCNAVKRHPNVKVKAAGGIRDLGTALGMIDAGARRLGCSAGVSIMEQYKATQNPFA